MTDALGFLEVLTEANSETNLGEHLELRHVQVWLSTPPTRGQQTPEEEGAGLPDQASALHRYAARCSDADFGALVSIVLVLLAVRSMTGRHHLPALTRGDSRWV